MPRHGKSKLKTSGIPAVGTWTEGRSSLAFAHIRRNWPGNLGFDSESLFDIPFVTAAPKLRELVLDFGDRNWVANRAPSDSYPSVDRVVRQRRFFVDRAGDPAFISGVCDLGAASPNMLGGSPGNFLPLHIPHLNQKMG